jgi:hypothetical protein
MWMTNKYFVRESEAKVKVKVGKAKSSCENEIKVLKVKSKLSIRSFYFCPVTPVIPGACGVVTCNWVYKSL